MEGEWCIGAEMSPPKELVVGLPSDVGPHYTMKGVGPENNVQSLPVTSPKFRFFVS